MTEKPPGWADWLLTVWVLVVALFYFGGYFFPSLIGRYTVSASVLYALMLLISAGAGAYHYLRRPEGADLEPNTEKKPNRGESSTRSKNRK